MNEKVVGNTGLDTRREQSEAGVHMLLYVSQIAGNGIFSVTGTTANGLKFIDLDQFQNVYNVSRSNMHRWIDKAPVGDRSQYCVSVGKKHFVSERIHEMGKAALDDLRRPEVINQPNKPGVVGIDAELIGVDSIALNKDEMLPVTMVTTDSRITYYELAIFAKRCGIHENTVRNHIDQLHQADEVHRSERWRYHIVIDGKHFVSPKLLTVNRRLRSSLRNLPYADWLAEMKWDVVGSVHFRFEVKQKAAVVHMRKLFQYLTKRYPGCVLNFVYTTEQNAGEDGYHNHFAFGSLNDLPLDQIQADIRAFLAKAGGRYESLCVQEPYRGCGNFLIYLVKEMHENPEYWDHMTT